MPKTMHADLLIIGAGAAGLFAAVQAGLLGIDTIIIEKNSIPGKKLLITGGGRCNICNAEFDLHRLVANYGRDAQGLYSTFSRFAARDLIDYFSANGLEIKIEVEQRAFPRSNASSSVRDLLWKQAQDLGVRFLFNTEVQSIESSTAKIHGVDCHDLAIRSPNLILATGGLAYPETGSTGDGLRFLQDLNLPVSYPEPSLVPIKIKEAWLKKLQGISIQDAKLKIILNAKVQKKLRGKILFTHFGLSGPLILNNSTYLAALQKAKPQQDIIIELQLFPENELGELDRDFRTALSQSPRKQLRNFLKIWSSGAWADYALQVNSLAADLQVSHLTKEQRWRLLSSFQHVQMTYNGLMDFDRAIINRGGLAPKAVNFKSMATKTYDNLYVVGDLLDINRPSGGFSLQICWSTAYVAVQDIAAKLHQLALL